MLNLPKETEVNKMVAKNKFYEKANISQTLKECFVNDIEKITWANKLAPSTLNISGSDNIKELEVFHIKLKTGKFNQKVLEAIDKAIPYYILFVLEYMGKFQLWLGYKEKTANGTNKASIVRYFNSEWEKEPCIALRGNKLDSIYENFLSQLSDKRSPAHCPCCMNRAVVKGINDFATFHPDDVKDWHPTKNGDLRPDMITRASSKRIWWKCSKCGHEWQTTATGKRGCPHCLHKPEVGKDDLATLYPEIAKEWHPTKNGDLTPNNVKSKSNKKVWWLCPNNHEYQAIINARTRGDNKGSNCPICNKHNRTSFPEQAVFYYIKQLYPDAINGYKANFLGTMELDIFIPSINWAIEYDGKVWHKEDKLRREKQKYQKCHKQGIKLLRIREEMAGLGSDIADEQIGIVEFNGKESLEETIKFVIQKLNFSYKRISINIKRDEIKIRESYQTKVKDSIAELYPELIKEWHPTKNGYLTPYDCKVGSSYKVWWKCPTCGYEWQASIIKRTKEKHGCLNCSKQAPLIGVNDLATLYPEVAKEWDTSTMWTVTVNTLSVQSIQMPATLKNYLSYTAWETFQCTNLLDLLMIWGSEHTQETT